MAHRQRLPLIFLKIYYIIDNDFWLPSKSNLWPHRLAARTSPSHGENWGSIPHGATLKIKNTPCECF